MKKYLVAGVVGSIIIALCVAAFFMYQPPASAPAATSTTRSHDSQMDANHDNDHDSMPHGSYTTYTEEEFAKTEGQRILYFHATWCPQCRQLDDSLTNATVPDGVTIFKVDYDTNQSLRQKYDVTLQTTLVEVDGNEEKIKSYVAYNEPSFDSVKKEFLD